LKRNNDSNSITYKKGPNLENVKSKIDNNQK